MIERKYLIPKFSWTNKLLNIYDKQRWFDVSDACKSTKYYVETKINKRAAKIV